MSEVDIEYVARLLDVAEKCGGHSGKLSSLQAWAIKELITINDEIKADAVEQAKADAEEAAKQAEVQAAADADQNTKGVPAKPGAKAIPAETLDDNAKRRL